MSQVKNMCRGRVKKLQPLRSPTPSHPIADTEGAVFTASIEFPITAQPTVLLGAVNNYSLSQVLRSTVGRGRKKKSMATRNPIWDTRMSGQNFNWNLVSCLIGLMNHAEIKVR